MPNARSHADAFKSSALETYRAAQDARATRQVRQATVHLILIAAAFFAVIGGSYVLQAALTP